MTDPRETIARFLALDAIQIASRPPLDCIMKSCTSTRQCAFPNNCENKRHAQNQEKP